MASNEPVAIFWDFAMIEENIPPTFGSSGSEIVKEIEHIAYEYGTVTVFKAYFEIIGATSSKSKTLRSELHSAGVSLTDCPHNGSKDVADKTIIVDMLAYAIDHAPPATIILISGDRDFAYAVSVLRLRRFRMIVVGPSSIHNSLKLQASEYVDWDTEIVGKKATRKVPLPMEHSANTDNHEMHRSFDSPSSSFSPDVPRQATRDPHVVDEITAKISLAPNQMSLDAVRRSITSPQPRVTEQELLVPPNVQREGFDTGGGKSELMTSFLRPKPGESVDQDNLLTQVPPSSSITEPTLDSMNCVASLAGGSSDGPTVPQPQTEVRVHAPQSGHPTAKASASSSSLILIGKFLRRRAGINSGRGLATQSSCSGISAESGGDRPEGSDAASRSSEAPVLSDGTRRAFWTKYRGSLMSLVTFEHLRSHNRDVGLGVVLTGDTLSSSSSSSVTTSPVPANCPPLKKSSHSDDERVHADTMTPIPAPSGSTITPPACTEARSVVVSPPPLATPTPSPDTVVSVVDYNISSPVMAPRLSPTMDQNIPVHAAKSPSMQTALIPSRIVPPAFEPLVKELQQHGACPERSAVAVGLLKRDPLTYQRAHITGQKSFKKYIALAVEAGIVTTGSVKNEGKQIECVSLNPAWHLSHDVAASSSSPDFTGVASTSSVQSS